MNMDTFNITYITLYVDYFTKDFSAYLRKHEQAEAWAREHNIKISPGPKYTLTTILEFTNNEDLLAFKLIFGELC